MSYLLITGILGTTLVATVVNYQQDKAIDRTKIPMKVEQAKGFQRWITNLKNKDFVIEADEFLLVDENELFNTKTTRVYNLDNEETKQKFSSDMNRLRDTKKVVYSDDNLQYIDYRDTDRDGYTPYQVRYFGTRDHKLIDAKLVDCSGDLNCYFDRGFFVNNDIFVMSELSRNLDKRAPIIPICTQEEECEYTFKIHVANLKENSRIVYESKPFRIILEEIKSEL